MAKVRVAAFSLSLDGYGAGPRQSLENPLGVGGMALHEWLLGTKTFFEKVLGRPGEEGRGGVDDELAARSFQGVGAWILGRNMFGPIRGGWGDESWRGWWGTNPPYHVPVFVLTHHPRAPLVMEGGTTFHFVNGGIHEALDRAKQAAGSGDVRIGGGAATIRQYLQAGLIDELHLALSPVLLGSGEPLFEGIDTAQLGYRCTEHVPSERATHVILTK
jgi:dihydrofolate reductase